MEGEHASNNYTSDGVLCFRTSNIASRGFWSGDLPVDFALPLLMAQIVLIFAATRFSHFILRRLAQPQFVSQIVAGIILGPSFLSRHGGPLSSMFPARSWIHLNTISLLCYVLYIFIVAVKTDLRFPRKSRRKAFAISQTATQLPFLFVVYLTLSFCPGTGSVRRHRQRFLVNSLSGRWAATSNAVLFCFLTELNLLTSKLGRLSMRTSLMIDIQTMIIRTMQSAILAIKHNLSVTLMAYSLLALVLLLAATVFLAKPLVVWMVRRTPEGAQMGETYVVAVVIMALVCTAAGEIMGQPVAAGAMILGLVLPGGPPLGTTLADRLERLLEQVFLPVYVAIAGLCIDFSTFNEASFGWFTVAVIAVSVAAKLAGVFFTGMLFGMGGREALVVAIMLNYRGIVELYTFRSWMENQEADRQTYAINVLSMMVVGGISAPLLKLLYNPAKHFLSPGKRRSVESNCSPSDELRALACTYDEQNASSLISLLNTSLPSPTCVYLLHLSPLVGNTTSLLAPYKPTKRHLLRMGPTSADHIVNAFRDLEHSHRGRLSLVPFTAVAPYSDMYNDVCQLALDMKLAIILLPFHRYASSTDGGALCTNPAVRAVNINVLHYAPCSVGIFVHYAASGGPRLMRSVVVYFVGGADDREALAYGARMADNPEVGLTVIRLVLPSSLTESMGSEEVRLDDEAVGEFRLRSGENKWVDYREEDVRDGAEMIEVVRGTCGDYSLVIVGRGDGDGSSLTAGLVDWSEYPELGVVGDFLASADMGEKVATLVVQQTPMPDPGGGSGLGV